MELRDIARLASCPMFSGVNPIDLAQTLASIPHSIRCFDENSVVFLSGCRYSSLYILIEGEAWAEMTSDEGKVVRVESFKAGESLAAAILFTEGQTLPVSVEAQKACRFVVIPKEGLLDLCMKHKAILEALLGEMGNRLSTLTDRLKAAQFISLREKLADWLLRRMELSGSPILHIEATRERMAELFGVARPSLSRELGALRHLGVIDFSGKEIRIVDARGLRRLRNSRASSSSR
ncbi:MAG: hypothetical protein CVV53_04910 [Spirochaetae bacterium HGW-Spirochaetae-9]|nr:MAG: hypothetical protein CVV53_04910 [Spirochaetae bacterium HGW-Spirochaetae-9]